MVKAGCASRLPSPLHFGFLFAPNQAMDATAPQIHMVVQRCESASLLVDEKAGDDGQPVYIHVRCPLLFSLDHYMTVLKERKVSAETNLGWQRINTVCGILERRE